MDNNIWQRFPNIMSLNFVQFVTQYKHTATKLEERSLHSVPKFFPTFSSNPRGTKFPSYCKHQLIKLKRRANTIEKAWDACETTNEIFILKWRESEDNITCNYRSD